MPAKMIMMRPPPLSLAGGLSDKIGLGRAEERAGAAAAGRELTAAGRELTGFGSGLGSDFGSGFFSLLGGSERSVCGPRSAGGASDLDLSAASVAGATFSGCAGFFAESGLVPTSSIDSTGWAIAHAVMRFFVARCGGLVHADGEGFYRGNDLVLELA